MASPRHIPDAAGSDSPPLPMETCDKENICHDQENSTLRAEGTVSTKRKKKLGGFNLRKSIAWNPAFFTEEGVLDNTELSVLSGSQMKPSRSPGPGVGGATASPFCRFGRSGSASVLKEVAEDSRGKLFVKYRTAENKGRKLFSPAKTSDSDELAGTQDKRSARSIQKCIPRSPAGYATKKVPNLSATAQMLRTPKKSQPSIPVVPTSASSSRNVSKLSKMLPPVKTERRPRVDGLQLKSKIKPTSSTKSFGPNIEKDVVPAVTAIHEEASGSRKCESFSTYSQNKPSSSAGVPTSTFAKPSALRMPSPSVGFFAQGKPSVNISQGNAKSSLAGNTSSLSKPPRYRQPEDPKSRLWHAPVSTGDTAQGNSKNCFTGNTSSLLKPPRYKQPDDFKSRHYLTKELPTNCPATLKPPVHPVTNESTLNTLDSSLPGLQHANVCSGKESSSKGIITYSAKLRNTNTEPMRNVNCFSGGSGASSLPLSSEQNVVPNSLSDALQVEGRGIINRTEPIEDSDYVKAICPSNIEPADDSCSREAKLSSSCISSQVRTLDDPKCQSKLDNCASVAIDMEMSLAGETAVAVSLLEDNNHTPGPDFLCDFDSCKQYSTEGSTLKETVESPVCADGVEQCGNSIDIKPALVDSTTDLHGSLCNEERPTSSEEPGTDGGVELDVDSSHVGEEVQLLIGCECDGDYRCTKCPPMEPTTPMPRADFGDSIEVTIDSNTEVHDSFPVEELHVLSEEPNTEDDMELDTNELSAPEDASPKGKNKSVKKSGKNTIIKDHLKQLVPFTEEWLAAMEACGEEVLEQKSGAVQNSPTDKAVPEPNPWSPVKRKAQDVGPFDCTKYSKTVPASDTP
ncbi:uncharacterized protein LOC104584814 isoform X1 [Brachypodium distachyon]|nr:uncharacterized protein LOC104584814 isoform X1 [Brachypodium distachyon]|eukprot:XP_010238833.1 uncharacterized protein LOC104584814 isoform X1 [Brachypodium distachyon]